MAEEKSNWEKQVRAQGAKLASKSRVLDTSSRRANAEKAARERDHKRELEALKATITKLKIDSERKSAKLRSTIARQKAKTEKLERDNTKLEQERKYLEERLVGAWELLETSKKALKAERKRNRASIDGKEENTETDIEDTGPVDLRRSHNTLSSDSAEREINHHPPEAREVKFKNGSVRTVSEDGGIVKVVFPNGDWEEVNRRTGTVRYFYSETSTSHIKYVDGSEVLKFSNGQTERINPQGVRSITYPDGTRRMIHKNGTFFF